MLKAKRATTLLDHAVAPTTNGSSVLAVQNANKSFWERN